MSDSLHPQAPFERPAEHEAVCDAEPEAEFQQLGPQQVVFEQRTSYVGSLIIGSVIIAATSPTLLLAMSRPWIAVLVFTGWILLLTLLVFSSHFWPPIAYRHTRWRLTEVGLEIRRGVLWRHRLAIPIARVQHVDVSQGPIQRMFELGKLTIHTAGTRNASVELDGLDHTLAMSLRDQLIEQKESLDVT